MDAIAPADGKCEVVAGTIAAAERGEIGEVYNLGGCRQNSCSMLEAISLTEQICGKKLNWSYQEQNRIGDHIWWISDVRKFQSHYPAWKYQYSLPDILREIQAALSAR